MNRDPCRAHGTAATRTPCLGQATRGAGPSRSTLVEPRSSDRHRRIPSPRLADPAPTPTARATTRRPLRRPHRDHQHLRRRRYPLRCRRCQRRGDGRLEPHPLDHNLLDPQQSLHYAVHPHAVLPPGRPRLRQHGNLAGHGVPIAVTPPGHHQTRSSALPQPRSAHARWQNPYTPNESLNTAARYEPRCPITETAGEPRPR